MSDKTDNRFYREASPTQCRPRAWEHESGHLEYDDGKTPVDVMLHKGWKPLHLFNGPTPAPGQCPMCGEYSMSARAMQGLYGTTTPVGG